MTKTVTYFEECSKVEVFKISKGPVQRLLVKKDGRPVHYIRFLRQSGKILNPKEY